jgi:hypothetical protein
LSSGIVYFSNVYILIYTITYTPTSPEAGETALEKEDTL